MNVVGINTELNVLLLSEKGGVVDELQRLVITVVKWEPSKYLCSHVTALRTVRAPR